MNQYAKLDLMGELADFFQKIKSSIYNPIFYKQIPQTSLGSAFGYFFLLILILTAFQSLFLLKPLIIDLPKQITDFSKNTITNYPSELEIKIEKGQASTNVKEPYFVTLPDQNMATNGIENLIVIDTKTPYSASQFKDYKSVAWLTKDTLFVQGSNTRPENRTFELSKISDFTLNKMFVIGLVDNFTPWIKFIGPAIFSLAFLGLYSAMSFRLIYLLALALLIMLLSKTFKRNLSYGSSFKTGLYAITLGFLVEALVFSTKSFTHFYGFPFMFTLITLCVIVLNFKDSPKTT